MKQGAFAFLGTLLRTDSGTGLRIYLLGVPVNGSSLVSWCRDNAPNMRRLLEETSCALEDSEVKDAGIEAVDTLLWLQGESDDPLATMVREKRFQTLEDYVQGFSDFCAVIDRQTWWRVGVSKLIAGELVRDGWLSARNDFYADPVNWPPGELMAVASSEGLSDVGDRAHFTGSSLQAMGERMADVWLAMDETGPSQEVESRTAV